MSNCFPLKQAEVCFSNLMDKCGLDKINALLDPLVLEWSINSGVKVPFYGNSTDGFLASEKFRHWMIGNHREQYDRVRRFDAVHSDDYGSSFEAALQNDSLA